MSAASQQKSGLLPMIVPRSGVMMSKSSSRPTHVDDALQSNDGVSSKPASPPMTKLVVAKWPAMGWPSIALSA